MRMRQKYRHFAKWPSRPHTRAQAKVLSPAAFIPLVILTMAATVLAQQVCSQTADVIPGTSAEWYLSVPTAEDLMDSLWRLQEVERQARLENLQECCPRTIQLYQRALERYLEELPRVHTSEQLWHHWWDDFNRQQEYFWNMWRAKFGRLFEQHLQAIWADSHLHRLEKTIPLTGSPPTTLTHEFGNIVIQGSSKPVAHLVAEIRVIATSQADAEAYAGEMAFVAMSDDLAFKVITRLPTSPPPTVKGTSIALQVELPQECPLEVENAFGDLRIQGFTHGLKARTGHGTLEIARCAGDLELHNRQGEIIVMEADGDLHVETSFSPIVVAQIQGDVFASNRFGPVSITGVSGAVQVENSGALIEIADVGGQVTVRNRLGLVTVQGVAGNLMVDNAGSPVRIADVQGETHIENNRGEIRAEGLAGNVIIRSRNGDIHLALDDIQQNFYRLDNSFGVVRVNLPPSPSAIISAEALYGTIDSDFPLEIKREGANQLARGTLGQGKANIQLDGRNTNIYLISSKR
jgi:hypothetical protein